MRRPNPAWLVFPALVWWMLASSHGGYWAPGVLAVGLAAVLYTGLGGGRGERLSVRGVARFAPFFLGQSLAGGVDVARRAFSPSLPLAPGFIRYTVRLSDEPARIFFLNTISLLPGTFSARLSGTELTIHALVDEPRVVERLRALEGHVAGMYGVSLT